MKKLFLVLFLAAFAAALSFSQQKYALVIGNADYTGISKLRNPVNDANSVATALTSLGFSVEKVLNGNLDRMETAADSFRRRLGGSRNTYGFFFYAGHGVQAGGDNYLIPVDAANIQSENHLRQRAVSVQTLLDNMNDAGNELNIIVLDACRDNPFGWARSGSRGLSMVHAPAGSIVMYATSAGSVADDGTGSNGLFTGQLLNNLKTPGLSVRDLFDKTGEDVLRVSGGRQHPELSVRFFGASSAYLGTRPTPNTPPPGVQPPTPSAAAKAAYDRGVEYFDKESYIEAIAEFDQAIRLDPNYAEAYAYRARSYNSNSSKRDLNQGLSDANKAIQLNPRLGIGYFARAYVYSEKNDYDRAIADYTEAIRLNPNFAPAYNNRGIRYSEKNDNDRAIADFTEAIRINPNYSTAYISRGNAFYDKKDYDRAIADYTEAIRINPNYSNAYNNRGDAYYNKKEYDRAIADYNEAIRLNPNSAGYYNNRGNAFYDKKDYDKAIADYEAALRIDPNYTKAKNNLENARKAKAGR
jgi:tetratricopeptide (TPR) repeat protein